LKPWVKPTMVDKETVVVAWLEGMPE